MTPAYLAVHTHDAHRGWTRIVATPNPPQPASASTQSPRIRYIARFDDGEAASMHVHEILKRRLLDADAHLYRATLEQAIGALESLDLRGRKIYWDPRIDQGTRHTIDQLADSHRQRRQRMDSLFRTFGYVGIAMLLFNLLVLSSS